jgi:hypothetical protein
MALLHPSAILFDIVGLKCSDRGRSCEEHTLCSSMLVQVNSVARIRAEQINVDGKEETAMACFFVADGIDCCKVGFLPRHQIKHKNDYDGKLAQIVEFLETSDSPSDRAARSHRNKGIAQAVILDAERETTRLPAKRDAERETTRLPAKRDITYIDRTTPTCKKKKSTPSKRNKESNANI